MPKLAFITGVAAIGVEAEAGTPREAQANGNMAESQVSKP